MDANLGHPHEWVFSCELLACNAGPFASYPRFMGSELRAKSSSYSFFDSAIFLAISSTILGRNSASTLSTMLAMACGSVAAAFSLAATGAGASGSDLASSGSRQSSLAGAGSAAAPAVEQRRYFQFAA